MAKAPTKEQIEAHKASATNRELVIMAAFQTALAKSELDTVINPIQADIIHQLFSQYAARLLNGRDAGVEIDGRPVEKTFVENGREHLGEFYARVEALGPDGCEECEKHWERMYEEMKTVNLLMVAAHGRAIQEGFKTKLGLQPGQTAKPGDLNYMKAEGNA